MIDRGAARPSGAEQARNDIAGEIHDLTGRELSKVTPAHRRDIEATLARFKHRVATHDTLILQLQTASAGVAQLA